VGKTPLLLEVSGGGGDVESPRCWKEYRCRWTAVDGAERPRCRMSEAVVVDAEPRNQFQLPRVMSSIDVGQTGASGGVTNVEGVQ